MFHYFLPFVAFVRVATFIIGAYEIDTPIAQLDAWAGVHSSLVGDFVDIENPVDINRMEARWQNGYTDFVNLMTTRTAQQIADGCCDETILMWASEYAAWQAQGGGRKAFLAPMPEMNGNWTSYGDDPSGFRLAYLHLRGLFDQAGASAWWVFAPNGWSALPYGIDDYYPGDDSVDLVGLSGFNWGTCQVNTEWQTPQQVFDPYIDEVRAMTTKPLIVAQFGTTSAGGNKDVWLGSAYPYFQSRNIHAAIYFNADKECDWSVYGVNSYSYATKSVPWISPQNIQGVVNAWK